MANYVLDVSRIPTGLASPTDDVEAYLFCTQTSTPSDQHCDVVPAADARVLGVVMDALDNDKVVNGGTVSVRVMGIAPVRLGTGGATAGANIVTAADGRGIASTTAGTALAGLAMQSGSQGSIIDVLLTPGGSI